MTAVGAEPDPYLDVANDLLATSAQCLDDHSPRGAPEELILGWGDVPHWCCDYLQVFLNRDFPTSPFPRALTVNQKCDEIVWATELVLKLRRCGYPKLEAKPSKVFPSAEKISFASAPIYRDLRILRCCLVARYNAGELFTNPNLPAGLGEAALLPVLWGAGTPARQSDCAGFDLNVTVGIYPCCDLPPMASGS